MNLKRCASIGGFHPPIPPKGEFNNFVIGSDIKNIQLWYSFSLLKNKSKMPISLFKILGVSFTLFFVGIWGLFLNRKNIIIMLMSLELMLLAVNVNFILCSVYLDDFIGQIFALLVLTVAAAESAIGLAILVVYSRVRGTIAVESIRMLNG